MHTLDKLSVCVCVCGCGEGGGQVHFRATSQRLPVVTLGNGYSLVNRRLKLTISV